MDKKTNCRLFQSAVRLVYKHFIILYSLLLFLSFKANFTKYFTSGHWFEWDLSACTTFRTNSIVHFSSVFLSSCFSTIRASFWLICKALFCVKFLFSGSECEFFISDHNYSIFPRIQSTAETTKDSPAAVVMTARAEPVSSLKLTTP